MMPSKPHTTRMPALHDFLTKKHFKFGINTLRDKSNTCEWQAYRTSEIPARDCETNGSGAQLVVVPFQYTIKDSVHESVEIGIRGEYNEIWYELKAYAMSPAELTKNFKDVEASLVRSWNALKE